MKLYRVVISLDIMVAAESIEDAERIGLDCIDEASHEATVENSWRVKTADGLPDGYDIGTLAYTNTRKDYTIESLLTQEDE